MRLSPGKTWGIRRLADANGRFKMTAVDQRPPIKNLIREKRGGEAAPWRDVAEFKKILVQELQKESSAMLLDPHFAYPGSVHCLLPAKGLILTLEDSVFDDTPGGRLSREIDHWAVEKSKRIGADAVTVLAWYRPDAAPAVRRQQQDFTARIGAACVQYDIPYVFELLLYPLPGEAEQTKDYVSMQSKRPELVLQSVSHFAAPDYAVDLFKLDSPLPAEAVPGIGNDGWRQTQSWFEQLGEAAGRPWVMLSAGADMRAFHRVLSHACEAGASGYLAGRAIWWPAMLKFPHYDAIRATLRSEAVPYMRELNTLTDAAATPWHEHACYGEPGERGESGDGDFRKHYAGFEQP